MKKIFIITAAFILFLVNDSNAQSCEVPASIVPEGISGFSLMSTGKVDTSYMTVTNPYGFEASATYYNLKCQGNPLHFMYYRTKGPTKTQMYVEVYKQEYDCDGDYIGSPQYLFSTTTKTYKGAVGKPIGTSFYLAVEPNTSYWVISKTRGNFFGWLPWSASTSNKMVFGEFNNAPSPSGNFEDVLSTESKVSTGTGYTALVHQLDVNGSYTFDASSTSCENEWRYEISELDLATWTKSNTKISSWIEGEATTFNMESFYPYGLDKGKLYTVKIIAGHGWYSKNYFFEIKNAKLVGNISFNSKTEETLATIEGKFKHYVLNERCQYNSMILNTTGTESVDKYRVRVQPVNASYSLIGSEVSTGIVTGMVPEEVNLGALYGTSFVLGQRYRVVYEVTSPGTTEIYYFRYSKCSPKGVESKFGKTSKKINPLEQSMDVVLYPNPTRNMLNIKLDRASSFQAKITLVDFTGKTVFSTDRQLDRNNKLTIDIADIADGVYFINIAVGTETVRKKIVKF
ncbi:MAG: hypothetical protein COA58_13025 [Bacteroidetes bacterium]|nr:MAG: hypothetical protein COA58_13025 [Bacteroidota bacterium]